MTESKIIIIVGYPYNIGVGGLYRYIRRQPTSEFHNRGLPPTGQGEHAVNPRHEFHAAIGIYQLILDIQHQSRVLMYPHRRLHLAVIQRG